jgi:ribose/xylose/arabinose/galactoside ABC-type transport system permease subunit
MGGRYKVKQKGNTLTMTRKAGKKAMFFFVMTLSVFFIAMGLAMAMSPGESSSSPAPAPADDGVFRRLCSRSSCDTLPVRACSCVACVWGY